MCTRNQWLAQEDEVLRTLIQTRKIEKWSRLAEIMGEEFGFYGKTGKKCRQRYYNHLDPNLNKKEWTPIEESNLIRLHAQCGNRWALIAKEFVGRTDNAVKNKFYSKMRKALRVFNCRVTALKLKPKHKPDLKMAFIYKVIEIIDKGLCRPSKVPQKLYQMASAIKEDVLDYEIKAEQPDDSLLEKQRLIALLSKIQVLNKSYKKKIKTKREEDFYESESSLSIQLSQSQQSVSRHNIQSLKEGFTPKTTVDYGFVEEDEHKPTLKFSSSQEMPTYHQDNEFSFFEDYPTKFDFFDPQFSTHELYRSTQEFFFTSNHQIDPDHPFQEIFDF